MARIKEIILKIIEVIMLITIALISFYHQMEMTMFQIPFDYSTLYKILDIMPIIIIIKAVLLCKEKALWLSLPPALVMYFAFPREHYFYEAFLGFLIIGCVGIRIKRIFCAAFVPATLVIVNMMIASLSGAITSLAQSLRGIRSYWGHISPTDFGTAVLFIVIFAWIFCKEIPDEYFLIPSLFSLYISFYITRSNTSGYLTVLFMIILVWRGLEKKVISGRDNLQWVIRVINMIMRMVFPVLGIFMIAAVFAYYKEIPFAHTLNTVLHKRIDTPANMYAYYGCKPFGTYFDMYGYGGSTIGMITEYSFIDSSYPQILIRYGWVTFIVANILWVYTTDRAIKTNKRRLAFAMTLLALDFVMEHHWTELSYNVFAIIPFADFGVDSVRKIKLVNAIRQNFEDKKYRIAFGVTGIVCLALLFLLLPLIFSYQRTLFNGYGFAGGGEGAKTVFAVITIVVVLLLTFILAVCHGVSTYVTRKIISRKSVTIIGIALVVAIAMFIRAGSMIDALTVDLADRIDQERDIISFITENAEGKVYVDKLPEAYIKSGLDIDRAYYSGEDLARSFCATVVVDASLDSKCFTSRGFLYMPISEQDAIYTNDDMVINALKKAGYLLKGYNSYVNKVDLDYAAEVSGAEKSEDGGILLGNTSHIFSSLPKIELTGGIYTVTYKLRIGNEPYTDDYKLGDIRITSYDGEKELARAAIMRSFFDDNGELDYEMSFTGYGRNIEFKANVEAGNRYEIISIEYVRTPDYDAHVKVDNQGRAIRTEYYDLEGNPKEMPGGYYGMENSYNKQDLPVYYKYLGSDFEPLTLTSGYCVLRIEYDRNKQIVRESYYDENDNPTLLPEGYQYLTRDYDFYGNVICEEYYGISGEPVLKNDSYHRIVRDYNDEKQVILEEYFGTDEAPILLSDGACGYRREYDDFGNAITIMYLGADGNPVVNTSGYAIVRRLFDAKAQITREEYYDGSDQPITLSHGHAAVEYEYDEAGNIVAYSYYDVMNEPVLYDNQYWRLEITYNDLKQNIMEKCFGTDGDPILLSDGASAYKREYDEAGNVAVLTYLDREGNPVINSYGYAILRRTYNDKKQITREEYHDKDDQPIALSRGQATVEYEYDEAGNRTAYSYYDVSNVPVLYNNQYWRLEILYNDLNQDIMEKYFGTDGSPTVLSDGASGYSRDYDEAGNVILLTYLDAHYNATTNTSGYSSWRRTFNDKKQILRESYFDTQDAPVALAGGQESVEYEYDENGNCTTERYYDVAGKPILYYGEYWYLVRNYNKKNQNIREEYYNLDGKLIMRPSAGYCRVDIEYDESGEVAGKTYYDLDGNVVKEE